MYAGFAKLAGLQAQTLVVGEVLSAQTKLICTATSQSLVIRIRGDCVVEGLEHFDALGLAGARECGKRPLGGGDCKPSIFFVGQLRSPDDLTCRRIEEIKYLGAIGFTNAPSM
jgi:hypothetical protein